MRALHDRVRHLLHLRRELCHLEQHDTFGGLLHLVDGVVHRGDQIADIAAVERRDEGAAHRDQHLARDVVGVLLAVHDDLIIGLHCGTALQHGAQRVGAGHHGLRMTRKQVEKALFLRHQGVKPAHHGELHRPRIGSSNANPSRLRDRCRTGVGDLWVLQRWPSPRWLIFAISKLIFVTLDASARRLG